MARHKDQNWDLFAGTQKPGGGITVPHDTVLTALLMDIRDELQSLNAVLHCHNFMDIPNKLDRIKRNTTRKRKAKVVGKPKLRVVR